MTTAISDSFHLMYLANCGMLIDYNGTRILLDALCADDSPFDRIPAEAETLLLEGCRPYDQIDLVLFTHPHLDHFNAEKTAQFMKKHPESQLMISSGIMKEAQKLLCEPIRNDGRPTILMDETEDSSEITVGSLSVKFMRMDHITFPCPDHYCIKISGLDKDLIFTADMDFSQLPRLRQNFGLTDSRQHFLFFNPILLGKKKWVEEAASWNPERIFIYHIPSEINDRNGYRKMAVQRSTRYSELNPQPELLLSPMLEFTV